MSGVQPIETSYAGCRFRSRLEARWARFFDALHIRWQYEPQGFLVDYPGGFRMPYLPDFLLPDCGTWVEVKGSDDQLDRALIESAAVSLPDPLPTRTARRGPRLLLLGPIPEPCAYEWAWIGLDPYRSDEYDVPPCAVDDWWGFDRGVPNGRLRLCDETSTPTPFMWGAPSASLLSPIRDMLPSRTNHAYTAARSARFEHGEAA